jgi:DNA-binding transcriptional LysR family regulator
MDFNDIPLFVRVVEAGSFTAAAVALGREKSSVSRSIARLEEELGVRLLQRTTRRLGLTDAGQTFFERVRGAVAGVEEAARAVQELGSEPRGAVRVTAPPDSDELGMAEAIAQFVERYPKIHVELTLTGRTVDLVAEGFDLALRAGRLMDSTLVARRVGSSDLALFAAPAYLKRRGRPRVLQDLAQHDCILFRTRGGRAVWSLSGPNGDETVEVAGSVSADEMGFVARTAAAGVGVANLPLPSARDFVRRNALERILPEYRFTGGVMHLVLPSAAFVPARVALLRDFLFEHLTRELAEANRQCTVHEAPARGAKALPAVRKRR